MQNRILISIHISEIHGKMTCIHSGGIFQPAAPCDQSSCYPATGNRLIAEIQANSDVHLWNAGRGTLQPFDSSQVL